MKKITLNVPDGIKYLSEWKELWNLLPMNQHYILNKRICGCGATEAYIGSDRKVILASPRKQLLYNKYSQHLSDNSISTVIRETVRSILRASLIRKRISLLLTMNWGNI